MQECTISTTNSGAMVPLCSCGWIGSVHPQQWRTIATSGRRVSDPDVTARNAAGEWRRHFTVDHAPLIAFDAAHYTRAVQPPVGRFGHS